ncbi:MAG: hypothetical protein ACHQHN_11270 [Sphingobacteriales bacterium]
MVKLVMFIILIGVSCLLVMNALSYNTSYFQTKGLIFVVVLWVGFIWWVVTGKLPGAKKEP